MDVYNGPPTVMQTSKLRVVYACVKETERDTAESETDKQRDRHREEERERRYITL